MIIGYAPSFVRQYKKLSLELKEEVKEKIDLFSMNAKNPTLRIYRLKGKLQGRYSFSVNYAYRIIFEYRSKKEILLKAVGDHEVYR